MLELDGLIRDLESLRKITGTNDKKDFLQNTCKEDEHRYILKVLLDSEYALGLKKIKAPKQCSVSTIRTFDELKLLIEKLNDSNINDAIRAEVEKFLIGCNKDTQEVLIKVLQKTYKIGITSKTLIQVFPGIIAEHPIALAKSPTEAEIQLPCIVDLKHDGIRYTQVKVNNLEKGKALTRDRNVMKFPKIENAIMKLLANCPEPMVVDAELKTIDDDFNKVAGIVSSNISNGYSEAIEEDQLVLVVFDLIKYTDFIGETKSKPQAERLLDLQKLYAVNNPERIELSPAVTVHSYDKVKELTDAYITSGKEGTIIKDPKAPYKKGKTSAWIKQKAINDCTLVCVGVTAGTNKREGKVGALMMETSDKLIKVNVGSGLTDEMVELYTKNPPIGRFFDVLFNTVSRNSDSQQMSLRLPRLKGERIDVKEADTFEKIKAQHIGAMMI